MTTNQIPQQSVLIQFELSENVAVTAWLDEINKLNITIKEQKETQLANKPVRVSSNITLNEKEIYSLKKSFSIIQAIRESKSKYWYHGGIKVTEKTEGTMQPKSSNEAH